MENIEVEAFSPIDESIVKQVRYLLDSEGRSEMTKTFEILLNHYEKTSGKVIYRFEVSCRTHLSFSLHRTLQPQKA